HNDSSSVVVVRACHFQPWTRWQAQSLVVDLSQTPGRVGPKLGRSRTARGPQQILKRSEGMGLPAGSFLLMEERLNGLRAPRFSRPSKFTFREFTSSGGG